MKAGTRCEGMQSRRSADEADAKFREPTHRRYLAATILARAHAEHVAIPLSCLYVYMAVGEVDNANRTSLFLGQTPGEYIGWELAAATLVMWFFEVIVDLLCFKAEADMHGLPIEETWRACKKAGVPALAVLGVGAVFVWRGSFTIIFDLNRDCLIPGAQNFGLNRFHDNLCAFCNATDMNADLEWMCRNHTA